MEALHLSSPLFSGWFAHLFKHFSPLVCLVELCLLMVFSSLTPLLASCSAKRATVSNPFLLSTDGWEYSLRYRLRWICFSSFSLENRVLFLNRPRPISPLSSSSSCLVVESLPLSDAISLRIKGLHKR